MSQGATHLDYELPWSGEAFSEKLLAFDTETEAIRGPGHNPRVVLATASDGARHAVLRPEQFSDFFLLHRHHEFVGHNWAFDHWVLDKYLGEHSHVLALAVLWQLVEENKVHDTMLLDMLVRLARGEGEKGHGEGKLLARNLGKLSQAYGVTEADKESPYRTRFSELWQELSWHFPHLRPFFDYAVTDTIATVELYHKLRRECEQACVANGVAEDVRSVYGDLTGGLQVKASIALLAITRLGVRVDQQQVAAQEALLREEHTKLFRNLEEKCPSLFKRYKKKNSGGYVYTVKGHTPAVDNKALTRVLENSCATLSLPVPKSKGKLGRTSLAHDDWAPHQGKDAFITDWLRFAEVGKLLGFCENIKASGDRARSRYNVLMRTGRISCQNINLTQIPRGKQFREMFAATPGYLLLSIDYKYIELRTLAAVLLKAYGKSVLAQTILENKDPHTLTAAMLCGMTYEELQRALRDDAHPEHEKAADFRQKAKICNFSIPGGLGAVKLVEYAKVNYGVVMSLREANTFREKIIKEVYPELALYLADTTLQDLSRALGLHPDTVAPVLDELCYRKGQEEDSRGMVLYCMGRVAAGKPLKRDGREFQKEFQKKLWMALSDCTAMSDKADVEIKESISRRAGSQELYNALFSATSITLTGRVRGGCTYTQARNNPFQALAADGIKMALWELLKKGHRVCGMIHDELLVELSEAAAEEGAREVEKVMITEMEKVLGGNMPVACSWKLGTRWAKG